MSLVDAHGRPTSAEPPPKPEEQLAKGKADVRTLPTGTLMFNLIKYSAEEIGLENTLHMMKQKKEELKMVEDPPQMARVAEVLQHIGGIRYVLAMEMNARFAEMDAAYCARVGVELAKTPDIEPVAESTPASE